MWVVPFANTICVKSYFFSVYHPVSLISSIQPDFKQWKLLDQILCLNICRYILWILLNCNVVWNNTPIVNIYSTDIGSESIIHHGLSAILRIVIFSDLNFFQKDLKYSLMQMSSTTVGHLLFSSLRRPCIMVDLMIS